MSRLLAAMLCSLLVFVAGPAAAQESSGESASETPTAAEADTDAETETPVACTNTDELDVLTPAGLESDIATPAFDGPGEEYKDYLVDLGATSPDATAPVEIAMTWDLPVNDYDLGADSAASSGFSENYQPLDPNEENVRLDVVKHCEVISVRAINFLAPVDLDELALKFTVGTVVTPPAPEPAPAP